MKMCINCLLMIDDQQMTCPHCGYAEGQNPMDYCHLPPRTRLANNRYIIGRPLGSGGFGVTYIAWDTTLDRRVAIKEYMPGEMAQRPAGTFNVLVNQSSNNYFLEGKRSFMQESIRLAQLGSIPGVVEIYDWFEDNCTAYIVMEYLEGETLLTRLEREEKISPEECVNIITPVLTALERIHAAGLIHRDIAPDNIMLCRDGRVVLIDFGAARHMTTRHSRSLSSILKIGYAPPEQYHSRSQQGSWTDVYAVGATMYHALTGVIPPDAYTRATNDTLEKPSVYAHIPRHIETAILNAMNVTVEKRTQTTAELAAELTGQRKAVRIPDPINRAKVNVSTRTKILLVIAAIAALAVILLLAFGVPKLILPDTEATVPEGMSRVPAIQTLPMDDAETILSDSDLRLRVAELIHDDFFDRDIVLYQNPGAGTVAYIGSMVDVTVSAPEETIPVPAVTGFDAAAAKEVLEAIGFVVVTREEFDDTAAPGAIIYQSVNPEEGAKPGTVIELVISRGPEHSTLDTTVEVTVPSVTGMTFEQAQQAMQTQGLYVVIGSSEFSDTVPSGQIIRQTPEQTANAHQGDTVTVVVSKGKQTATVPDLRYNSEQAARTKATNSNLNIKINYEESLTVGAGLVIRQDIAAGTTLNPGDTVTVWVSTGYQVTVPDCVGKTQLEAAGLLSEARLSYIFTNQNSATVPEGQIISQSVAKGQKVEQGTTVTLAVSTGTRTVPVTGVSLSQSKLTMNINDSATLAATVKPADATSAAVTWSSNNPGVAQVDAGGRVTARGAGTATITVTTADGGKTASCTVTVNRTLSSIDIVSLPAKTSYFLKGSLDRTGLSVRANYNDGTTADVTSKCTLSGFDSSVAGTKTVTVSYAENGVTRNASFTVVVSAPLLSYITVNSYPTKTSYYVGESLDKTGLSVTAHYTDGSSANVSDRCTLTGFDSSRNGSQTISITYSEGGIVKGVSYNVTVAPVPLSSIAVTSQPYKTSYYIGDSLDTTGLVVTATYTNSATAIVTDRCSFSGFEPYKEGTQTVTVSYTDNGIKKSASFVVTVIVPHLDLITYPPTTMYVGETFDLSGCYKVYPPDVTVTYTSSESYIASVSGNGMIQANSAGAVNMDLGFVYAGRTYGTMIRVNVKESEEVSPFTYNVENNEAEITGYNGTQSEITIPSVINGYTVSRIDEYAFFNNKKLTSVIIPNSVTNIEAGAFNGCTGLTSITIPDSVTGMGGVVFDGCTGLKSVALSRNLTSVPYGVFMDCTGLTSVTIPNGITGIDGRAFRGCTNLTSVSIPGTVTSIGEDAFYECTKLTSVTIPNSVTSIGAWAFYECDSLTSVTIPNSVTSIEALAFSECDKLASVTLSNKLTDIGESLFSGCKSLASVTIPGSVAGIGKYAFRDCIGLTSVTISDGVTSIGKSAFEGCTGLTSIFIPDSVTRLSEYAFVGCSGVVCIAIPDSVTSIGNILGHGDYLFGSGDDSLTTVYCNEGSAAYGYYYGAQKYTILPYDQYPY